MKILNEEPDKNLSDNHLILSPEEIKKVTEPDIYAKITGDHNFIKAAAFGLLASISGAILWAVVTYYSQFQFAYMAIGVGALVGFTIRYSGKGITTGYSVMGSLITFLGCMMGNYLTVLAFETRGFHFYFLHSYRRILLSDMPVIMIRTLHPVDLLFYAIAIYEGFRFSTLRITER